jgi:hypothetical protein
MEEMPQNPFLEQEDYMSQYRKNIEELKNRPEYIEYNLLCYELFDKNPQGKKFLELSIERYLIPALANRGTATYQIDVIWAEGFKEFLRFILSCIRFHKQQISTGK